MRKRILSILLILCISMPMNILPTLTVHAASTDRTDMVMDFEYPYSTPTEAMGENNKYKTMGGVDNLDALVNWKHVTSYNPDSTKTGFRGMLESTKSEDKYIRLDVSCNETYGWGDLETIEISTDKVLDLNGQTIQLNDIRNKVDKHGKWTKDQYYQSSNDSHFRYSMFTITSGATLTIIDSSKEQTGEIYYNAYMINPYQHNLKRYTTRDLFSVPDGNLVIYGGTFRAGRSKLQSDDDTLAEVKAVIGEAVEFGTVVTEYATGISSAQAALKDVEFNTKSMLEKAQKTSGGEQEDPAKAPADQTLAATPKADGSNSVEEKKESTPDTAAGNGNGRNQTVDEKQKDKDNSKENKANDKGTAKDAGPNSKLQTAKNAVVNAATDKSKINSMVDSGFKVIDAIKNLFSDNEKSVVTQSLLGTVVHVGNGGSFVSYGGTYKGYGMTPNTRNAVVETTKLGKVYVYDGTFNGLCGANIFNIVEDYPNVQKKVQYVKAEDGEEKQETVNLGLDETNGLRVIEMEDDKFVDTSNIRVRGGTFNCGYELLMVGLHEDETAGSGLHDGEKLTIFPGSKGTVNLGVESFDENLIRDGRIQICDNYGDGALVLMDENKGENDKTYHYRLFCSSEELRYKYFLSVYPNEAKTNSSYSFSLQNRYGTTDSNSYDSKSKSWTNGEEAERAAYSSNEMYFDYVINSRYSEKEYVIPYMTDTDPFAKNLDTSDVWYYNTPLDADGDPIRSFTDYVSDVTYTYDGLTKTLNQKTDSVKDWDKLKDLIKNDKATNTSYETKYRDYYQNLKWLTYKVYRVDPLTRGNISESSVYGVDEPLVKVVYGASDEALKCRLPLNQLPVTYKAGEMYRVVLSVDEYAYYGPEDATSEMPVASCESSIVFMCHEESEMKQEGDIEVPDYTPLQWCGDVMPGNIAQVQLVNGKAGQVDYESRKIFDVYYQWYVENPGGEDQLIAGTDNVYMGDASGLANHSYLNFKKDTTHKYLNTVDPKDPKASTYINGLPTDRLWKVEELHAYTDQDTPDSMLTRNPVNNLSLANNNNFATNFDSIYIPEELAGKTIYCKAITVNTLWQKNFDHVQTFYSHKVKIPAPKKKREMSITASTEMELGYVSPSNPMTISFSEFKDMLDEGEYVSGVTYYAKSGSAVGDKAYKKLTVRNLEDLPSAVFPKDFTYGGAQMRPNTDYQVYAKLDVSNASGEWIYSMTTKSIPFVFEKEATGFSFSKNDYYNRSYAYYAENQEARDALKAVVSPIDASLNAALEEGVTFTSSNPDVVTLNYDGTARFSGKPGMSTLTLKNPDGSTETLNVLVPVSEVVVKDIEEPVIGQTLDTTAEIPAESGYAVQNVYWTEGKEDFALAAGTKAKAYTGYTVHVVLKEAENQEFASDQHYALDMNEHYISVPYSMAIMKDGLAETRKGIYYGEGNDNTRNSIELTYEYTAQLPAGAGSADTIILDYPEEVAEGTTWEEFVDQIEVKTAVGEAAQVTVTPYIGMDAEDILRGYGYRGDFEDVDVMIKGVQKGFKVTVQIPASTGAYWAAGTTKLVRNGVEGFTAETPSINGTTTREILIEDNFDVVDGKKIVSAPTLNYIYDISLAELQTVNLNDYVQAPDGTILSYGLSEGAEDYLNLDEESGILEVKAGASDNTFINGTIYAKQQVEKDSSALTQVCAFRIRPYKTVAEIPGDSSFDLTVKQYDADGSLLNTFNYPNQTIYSLIQLPEHQGDLISTFEGSDYAHLRNGSAMIDIGVPTSQYTISVYSQKAADSIHVHPGATEVMVDYGNLESMDFSLDGAHWQRSGYFSGLKPSTLYTMYYRQGTQGTIYEKQFKTARTSYDIIVGGIPVTNEYTGNLEEDGWHYDIDERKLTIKNLNLTGQGNRFSTGEALSMEFYSKALILVKREIDIEILGDNVLNMFNSQAGDALIYSEKNITLSGTGSLSYSGSEAGMYMVKGSRNITIDMAGSMRSGKSRYLIGSDMSINYYNGTLECGYAVMYQGVVNGYLGRIFQFKSISTGDSIHTMQVYDEELGRNLNESEYDAYFKSSGHHTIISSTHTCDQKVAAEAYYAGGSCTSGPEFYLSCKCGFTDKAQTFKSSSTKHNYESFEGKEATCITDGWEAYKTCTLCGTTNYTRIPAFGHSYEYHAAKEATCTEKGWNAYNVCTTCGYGDEYVEIPVKGHILVSMPSKDATCTADGYNAYEYCTVCDYTTYEKIAKNEHDLVHYEGKDATADTSGYKAYDACKNCDYTTYEVIPPLGHTHSLTAHPAKEATCTEKGNIAYYTCDCGKWFEDESCTKEITDHTAVEIAEIGHEAQADWLNDETSHWHICAKCGELMDKAEHVLGDNEKICSVCNYEIETPLDHTHSGGTATCTAKAKCSTCGEEYGELAAHSYTWVIDKEATTTATGLKHEECTVCGYKEDAVTIDKLSAEHTHTATKVAQVEATCAAYGVKAYYKCSCGKYYTDSACTKEITDLTAWKNGDGRIAKKDHTLKTTTTKATLTANGKMETKCTVCGKVTKTETIYAAKTIKLSATKYTYDGKAKKPTVTIKDSEGNAIASTNYTVTYPSGRKDVGKYTVKVTFKGNYSGSKNLTFTINPPKTSISKVTAGKKAFTVKWAKKTTQVTGYEIQYSTSSTFAKGNKTVKVTSAKTVSKTISKLTGGKKYYVRIRTYKTVGKTPYYSDWSAKKSVTTKK